VSELSSRKLKAISALLLGKTQAEAAQEAGIADRTLRNWLHDPDFATEMDRQRYQLAQHALASLLSLSSEAAKTMRALLRDDNSHIRYRTAAFILDQASAQVQQRQLEELAYRAFRIREMSDEELNDYIAQLEGK
jgi:hypothetical protein